MFESEMNIEIENKIIEKIEIFDKNMNGIQMHFNEAIDIYNDINDLINNNKGIIDKKIEDKFSHTYYKLMAIKLIINSNS